MNRIVERPHRAHFMHWKCGEINRHHRISDARTLRANLHRDPAQPRHPFDVQNVRWVCSKRSPSNHPIEPWTISWFYWIVSPKNLSNPHGRCVRERCSIFAIAAEHADGVRYTPTKGTLSNLFSFFKYNVFHRVLPHAHLHTIQHHTTQNKSAYIQHMTWNTGQQRRRKKQTLKTYHFYVYTHAHTPKNNEKGAK